jgi:XTP/dITP diphosphohydrolase
MTGLTLKELVIATRNRDKGAELQALLKDLGLRIRTLQEFPDAPEVVEDAETCRGNAIKKATEIANYSGLLTVADDTGLEVEALGGRPGALAARYAGEHATYDDNCRKLLQELKGIPWGRRRAKFITVAAVAQPAGQAETVEGVLEGVIAEEPQGSQGFGYDPIFFVPEFGKTLAQLTFEQKNRISHRARAFQKAKDLIQKISRENVGA